MKMGNIRPFFILGVYQPPEGKSSDLFTFLEELMDELDLLRNEVYIMGDMNINYISTQTLRKLKLKNFESQFGLKQLIKMATLGH